MTRNVTVWSNGLAVTERLDREQQESSRSPVTPTSVSRPGGRDRFFGAGPPPKRERRNLEGRRAMVLATPSRPPSSPSRAREAPVSGPSPNACCVRYRPPAAIRTMSTTRRRLVVSWVPLGFVRCPRVHGRPSPVVGRQRLPPGWVSVTLTAVWRLHCGCSINCFATPSVGCDGDSSNRAQADRWFGTSRAAASGTSQLPRNMAVSVSW